ncbi:MAG: sensor histidine kinase [Nevskiaceae bacterium]
MAEIHPLPPPHSPPSAGLAEAEEIAPFGVWEWDITRNTVRWSEGLYRIYGLARGEFPATYEGYLARVHADDRARVHNAVQQAYRQRAPFEFEERVVRPSGEVRWLLSRGQVACDARGQPMRMTGVCQDITPFRQAHAGLAARIHALERGADDVEQFSQTAVQNLQEPLRIVEGYAQKLAEPGANVAEWSRMIRSNAVYMQQFVAALLAYVRAGQGFQPMEALDLESVLADAQGVLGARIRDSGATITHDPLPSVTADRAQLGELFERLLDNALRHRGEARPRVHVSAVRAEGYWVVSVRDNGRGLEAAQLERVFTLLARRAPAPGTPGPGIGLAICRKIVARHAGRIWAASDGPGKGATFSFTLPDPAG